MARYVDFASLPDDVARYAQGQVTAGRFATLEDVLTAGIEALQQRDEADQSWAAYARAEAETAFAELDRNEGVAGTVDEHMGRLDAALAERRTARTEKK